MADKATSQYKQLVEVTDQVIDSQKRLETQIKSNIETNKQLEAQLKGATGAKQLAIAQKELQGNIKATSLAEKEAIKNQELLRREQEKTKREILKTTKAEKDAREESKKLGGEYRKLSRSLTDSRNRAKDLALAHGLTSKQFKEERKNVIALDRQLKKLDASLGQNQRSVGNYGKAWAGVKNILGAAGVVGGLATLVNVFKKGIQTSREFEKQSAVLAGVLGRSNKEIGDLTANARKYGKSTAFTASQVLELEISLARLGKTERDIIDSTEGIINATLALGSETGETAELVGGTLNVFKKGATESTKVADILTLATQRSALTFQKLNTALPTVGGTASAVGVSLEEVVAQLGQAADRGIDASTAGTALRNIYLELSAKGLTLNDALKQVNNSTDKASAANELFGKRAVSTAIALADNVDKTKELTNALRNSGGTAEKVARVQLNTMDGRVKLLNSALEGFILNIFNMDGAFGTLANSIIEITTGFFNVINALFDMNDAISENEAAIKSVLDQYGSEKDLLDDSEEARQKLIKSLELEGLSYEEAKKEANKYLTELKLINDEMAVFTAATEFQIGITKMEIEQLEKTGTATDGLFEKKQKLANLEDQLIFKKIKLSESTDKELQDYLKLQNSLLPLSDAKLKFIDAVKLEIDSRKKLTVVTGEEEIASISLIEVQEKLLKQAKKMAESTEPELAAKNRKIELINKEISRLKALGKEQDLSKGFKPIDTDKLDEDLEKSIEQMDKFSEEDLDIWIKNEDKKTKILKEAENEREQIRQKANEQIKQGVIDLGNALFEAQDEKLMQESERINEEYDARLANEQLDDEQRNLLEAKRTEEQNKLAKKRRDLEKKQFLFNQSIKLAEIAVDTITKVAAIKASVGVLAALPFPLNLQAPLAAAQIPLVITSGAIAAAAVAAQSIPAFDVGTKSLPENSLVGEKRPELLIKDGQVSVIDKPTFLGKEYKGAEIIGGAETARIMDNITRNQIVEGANIYSEKRDDAMIAMAIDKAFGKHSDRMINELKKNRGGSASNDAAYYNSMNKYGS